MDECKIRPPVCSQSCTNRPGDHRCDCYEGYNMEKDGNCTGTVIYTQLRLSISTFLWLCESSDLTMRVRIIKKKSFGWFRLSWNRRKIPNMTISLWCRYKSKCTKSFFYTLIVSLERISKLLNECWQLVWNIIILPIFCLFLFVNMKFLYFGFLV